MVGFYGKVGNSTYIDPMTKDVTFTIDSSEQVGKYSSAMEYLGLGMMDDYMQRSRFTV